MGTLSATRERDFDPNTSPSQGLGRTLARTVRAQGLLGMLFVLVITFTIASPYFLTWNNAFTIGGNMSVLAIMGLAQTFLIVSGGVDLSLGAVAAFTTVLIGLMANHGVNPWLAAAVGLLCGPLVGAFNGAIVVWLGINPLITTLGTLSILTGAAYVITQAQAFLVTSPSFEKIGAGHVGPVPVPLVIFAALFVVALVVERMTLAGRWVYAIGGNAEASRLAGISVNRVRFTLYVVSGLSASIAGVIVTAQLGSAAAQVGTTYLLAVVTAVILGGTSLEGGRGTVIGTLIAAMVLGVLENGISQVQLSSYFQNMALGIALLMAVIFDRASARQASMR